MGTTYEAFESYKFHIREQQKHETIEAYVAELRKLAKNSNFADEDRMLRDRIVVGVHREAVREKLLEIARSNVAKGDHRLQGTRNLTTAAAADVRHRRGGENWHPTSTLWSRGKDSRGIEKRGERRGKMWKVR